MVATGKDDNSVHCRCTHLSMFGSSLFVPPNRLNPIEDIVLFLDVVNNMYVVVLVSVFVLFYIIVLLWACRKDRKDIRERGIIELEDNCPGETQGYLCAVYTGANISAGTTANVAIKLVGSAGSSRVHILGCSGFRTLQTGQDNWFLMFTQRRLGRLKYIHLWHDNSGSSPDWYCDKILVYDLETKAEYIFLVRRWLSVLETDDKLEYKISCASESDLKNWNTLTKENLQLGFRETHLWISVFIRHPRSAFSRSQRLSVAMCMIMTNMLVSLLFYGAAKTTYADDPSYSLGLREIIVSIESALITVPLTFMVAFCFKKSRPTYETNLYETDAPKDGKAGKKKWTISNCCKNPEIIFTMLGNAVELRPLLPASLNETDKRQRRMRQFWFIAAWSFCMGVILVSSFFIMLLGLKVGANRSLLWMSAILIGFFQGIFIAQPLKIVIIALALGLIFKVERMKRSKSEAEKRILFASIVTLFVLVLFIIISRMQIKETNESSNHVKNLVTMKDKYNTTNLEEIYTTAMFYEYFKTSLFPEIHAVKWYNDRLLDMEGEVEDGKNNSLNKFTGWTSDYSSKLVGVIRIRQHRVKTNSCLVPALFSKIFHTCNIALNTYSEDIARYGVGWKRSDKIDPGSSSWAYTSQWESETNGMFETQAEDGFQAPNMFQKNKTQEMTKNVVPCDTLEITRQKSDSKKVFGGKIMTHWAIRNWFVKFHSEDVTKKDRPREVHRSDIDDNILKLILEENPHKQQES
ncbi:hypothetical protein AAG570_011566 [Ranatra chinensis]|uniref:PLAT domain-containing protein n=1 Tax=Ranatra chinensis TaxID=642074 RepID=A0ABD0YL26_9HEMI